MENEKWKHNESGCVYQVDLSFKHTKFKDDILPEMFSGEYFTNLIRFEIVLLTLTDQPPHVSSAQRYITITTERLKSDFKLIEQ